MVLAIGVAEHDGASVQSGVARVGAQVVRMGSRCYLGHRMTMPEAVPARAGQPAVARARALTRLLDDAIVVPGTRFRIGLDPILGLVPGIGDLVGGAMSAYLLLLAQRAGAPTSVLVRMLGNLGIDTIVGAVPFLGDLFDAGWKANRRNLTLVERYLDAPVATRRASRWFVAGAILVIGLITAGALAITIWLVRLLLSLL